MADKATSLLPADALRDLHVGVSISNSPDLPTLGLLPRHVELALGEVTRTVLLSGGSVAYGGHLDPGGFTAFLEGEVQKYTRRRDAPLRVYLAWSVHRALPLSAIRATRERLALSGKVVTLDPDGQPIDPTHDRGEGPCVGEGPNVVRASLTGLREHMNAATHARIVLGGKREGFTGRLPGVIEEAILAVRDDKPLYVAGGFGGAAADIAEELGFLPDSTFPFSRPVPEAVAGGLRELREQLDVAGWRPTDNGLTDDENRRLAVSHRPSDVASLVAVGLARRYREQQKE